MVASWTPQKHHEAFEGVLNGGIIGALLDCHCNWAAAIHLAKVKGLTDKVPCTVTADYAIALKRPCPTNGPVQLKARVIETQGERAIVEIHRDVVLQPRDVVHRGDVIGAGLEPEPRPIERLGGDER